MKVTKLNVASHTGSNKRPHGGDATFDDGKQYEWMFLPEGDISFFYYRNTHQGTARSMVSFRNAKRQMALLNHINSGDF